MSNVTTKSSKNLIIAAITVYGISLILYLLHFGGHGFSRDTSVWGQFGDFMGGMVNPILGVITIWFLAVTLKQSEFSHDQQIHFAAEVRDFEICMALISYYEKSANELLSMRDTRLKNFHLAAGSSLTTLDLMNEGDREIRSSLGAMKIDIESEVKETERKSQQFFELANELKPMLEMAHLNLRMKYIKK